MTASVQLPVAIVGGGFAGLVAASALRQHGVPFVLFEGSNRLAGLAQTHRDADGFTYDVGAHFITNRLAAALGLGAECRDVEYYGESVWLDGRVYRYPFGLLREPRFLASGLAARVRGLFDRAPPRSAADHFRATYGRALADRVARPILEAWSGASADDLAPAVAEKLPHGITETLYLKLAGRLTHRAVALGYSQEMPEHAQVWHVYPAGGLSLLIQHLAAPLTDAIQLDSPVQAIVVKNGRAVAVRVHDQEHRVAAVISTAPVHVLPRLVVGTDAFDFLARFRYRPMTFVNLRLEGRHLLPDTVLWTLGDQFPFFRVTETTASMPWLAPPGKTLLTLDFGCQVGDATWTMGDHELTELSLTGLKPIIPDAARRALGASVLRTPLAYPIFLNEYEADRRRFLARSPVERFYSIGRNGEFAHSLMEDVYWRTLRTMREVLAHLSDGCP